MSHSLQDAVFYHDPEEGEPFEMELLFDDDQEEEEDEEQGDGAQQPEVGPAPLSGLRRLLGLQPRQPEEAPLEDEVSRREELSGPEEALREEGAASLAGVEGTAASAAGPEAVGFFEKRSPWWVEGWRRRAYVLRDRKLLYFNQACPDRPLGVLDFGIMRYELHCCWQRSGEPTQEPQGEASSSAKVPQRSCDCCEAPAPQHWRTFYLRPTAFPSKVFAFRGPDAEMLGLAAKLAGLAAESSDSAPATEQAVVSLQNFWRYPFLPERDFARRAESGDLLLFRGKDTPARLQRAATGALYDHVALLLRTSAGKLALLEATGRHGVNILSWEHFTAKRWQRCYAWLAYRKVYFGRTAEQLLSLQEYVASVLGQPYGLTVAKLLDRTLSEAFDEQGRRVSSPARAGGGGASPAREESREEGLRSFFCSELAAACLKRCGVLAGARASTRYWPGSFSQHSPEPLPLQEHAYVGEEQVLLFDD